MSDSTIPGPTGNRFFGRLVTESRRDPLAFMTRLAQTYGDVCSFRVGFEHIFFVNHPDHVLQSVQVAAGKRAREYAATKNGPFPQR